MVKRHMKIYAQYLVLYFLKLQNSMESVWWEVMIIEKECGVYRYGLFIERENKMTNVKCGWGKASSYQIGISVGNMY